MLEVAADAWRSAGYRVRGLALQGKAAAELEGSNIESTTIHAALLKNQEWTDEKGKLHAPSDAFTANDILIVDEAGMNDSRLTAKLTAAAREAGVKLVEVGDTIQLQAIGAGGALNAKQKEFGGADAELTTIQRQNEAWSKEMVTQARHGHAAEALKYLFDRNALQIDDDKETALESTVGAWDLHYSHARPGSSFMIANTNADVNILNEKAREKLKKDGILGGVAIETGVENRAGASLGKREFLESDRIVLNRNAKLQDGTQLKNGQTGSIESIEIDQNGEQFLHIKRDTDQQNIRVPLAEYKAISHGYALTTHKSQGLTAENVSVFVSGKMQDLHSFYVQITRMKFNAHVSMCGDAIEAEMMNAEPTEKMTQWAADIAAKKGLNLPGDIHDNFRVCRDFLNEHSDQNIGGDLEPWARDIGQLIESMSKERIKETTLDYDLVEDRKAREVTQDKAAEKKEEPEKQTEKQAEKPKAREPEAEPAKQTGYKNPLIRDNSDRDRGRERTR